MSAWGEGVCFRGRGCLSGGCLPKEYLPRCMLVYTLPGNRITDRFKNITLPQTSFAGGNTLHLTFIILNYTKPTYLHVHEKHYRVPKSCFNAGIGIAMQCQYLKSTRQFIPVKALPARYYTFPFLDKERKTLHYDLTDFKYQQNILKLECIPVGCVPPAAVSVGGSPPGTPREQTPRSGHPQEQTPPGSRHPPQSRHPPCEQNS